MFYLKNMLKKHGNINVSIVGAGIMGSSLTSILSMMENLTPRVLSSRGIEKVLKAFKDANIDDDKIKVTDNIDEAREFFKKGFFIATTNNKIAASMGDVIVDCTGDTKEGTDLSLIAIENELHVVSLNVEMDATVGPYLKRLADEKGVVYTGTSGDEPGAIMELYEFLKTLEFDVLVLGKGKNNPLNNFATNDMLREEAISKGLNPRMLTSFVDGTNTMIELNSVCNATGFLPDIRGCHCFETTPKDIAKDIDIKENGGKLNSYNVVDFSIGIAPGVFAIVRSKSEIVQSEMNYLKMGDGPNFAIYRPFHLTSIETPNSIIRAVVLKDSSISPINEPVADTITIAKRDIKAGEKILGIGSDDVYGVLESYKISKEESYLPIGLITDKTYAINNIKKGNAIKYSDVKLDEECNLVKIRREQDKIFNKIVD